MINIIYYTIFELVCNSQSSKAFKLAAAYLQDYSKERDKLGNKCQVPERICSHLRKVSRNSKRRGGNQKPNYLKESMKLNWYFQRNAGRVQNINLGAQKNSVCSSRTSTFSSLASNLILSSLAPQARTQANRPMTKFFIVILKQVNF